MMIEPKALPRVLMVTQIGASDVLDVVLNYVQIQLRERISFIT